MKKQKYTNKGITLIALVITIIVLLILVGITIAMLTGENGILEKAKQAEIQTDIAETKEQIKLEIMGNVAENGDYTDKNVIDAIKKITGNDVLAEAETVKTKKKNDVDIRDLWKRIHFTIDEQNFTCPTGTTWKNWDWLWEPGYRFGNFLEVATSYKDEIVLCNGNGSMIYKLAHEGTNATIYFNELIKDGGKYIFISY